MNELFEDFAKARQARNGYELAQTLSPVPPTNKPHRLIRVSQSTNSHSVKGDIKHYIKTSVSHRGKLSQDALTGWVEVYAAYWKAIEEILAGEHGKSSWNKVYEAWKDLTSMLVRGYNNFGFEAWTIPSLYMVGKYLRLFAIKADAEPKRRTPAHQGFMLIGDDFDPDAEKQSQLRDAEQHLKRIFSLCLTDRAPLEESRKWGIYFVVNLLFKTYFKLGSASMSKTILTSLAAYEQRGDLPPLASFPKSQRVTFRYYEGVLFFLEENYANLLAPFPRLQKLFGPLTRYIRQGDLRSFDQELQKGEEEFVRHRIYLTLERGRDVAMRNLLRKVFIAGGFEESADASAPPQRRTRIPLDEFQAAISMGSGAQTTDPDEVECFLANQIYKASRISSRLTTCAASGALDCLKTRMPLPCNAAHFA
ncbi:Protein CSN12 [Emericellopsis cladophorae]|uniref:Protein CSN12 n=1 Tax=Emericellopsis cladophorae TaxID=2686198 RepID=A0A9P9Y577_9HYPO|nr:Protein CSN12 [Emericellopsis cladophorae]KAI6783149.1 Protein CSN12 [Emericellopsis cladophorae]